MRSSWHRFTKITLHSVISYRNIFGGLGNNLFQGAYIYAQARRGEIPDIYLQDPKYFADFAGEIKSLYGQGVEPIDMVSLHVRRGDYIHNQFYVDHCETGYYDKAMAKFPDAKFLVFCADRQEGSNDQSDMEWCKQRFQGKQFEFSQGKNEIEDFNLMAGCKGHITANSSFSWWAAYVGGGKTVTPERWFSDGEQRISLPEEWIKL